MSTNAPEITSETLRQTLRGPDALPKLRELIEKENEQVLSKEKQIDNVNKMLAALKEVQNGNDKLSQEHENNVMVLARQKIEEMKGQVQETMMQDLESRMQEIRELSKKNNPETQIQQTSSRETPTQKKTFWKKVKEAPPVVVGGTIAVGTLALATASYLFKKTIGRLFGMKTDKSKISTALKRAAALGGVGGLIKYLYDKLGFGGPGGFGLGGKGEGNGERKKPGKNEKPGQQPQKEEKEQPKKEEENEKKPEEKDESESGMERNEDQEKPPENLEKRKGQDDAIETWRKKDPIVIRILGPRLKGEPEMDPQGYPPIPKQLDGKYTWFAFEDDKTPVSEDQVLATLRKLKQDGKLTWVKFELTGNSPASSDDVAGRKLIPNILYDDDIEVPALIDYLPFTYDRGRHQFNGGERSYTPWEGESTSVFRSLREHDRKVEVQPTVDFYRIWIDETNAKSSDPAIAKKLFKVDHWSTTESKDKTLTKEEAMKFITSVRQKESAKGAKRMQSNIRYRGELNQSAQQEVQAMITSLQKSGSKVWEVQYNPDKNVTDKVKKYSPEN